MAESLFKQFHFDAWKTLPLPQQADSHSFREMTVATAPLFSIETVNLLVKEPIFCGLSKMSWEERFDMFFPATVQEAERLTGQGWKLDYLAALCQELRVLSREEVDQLRELLRRKSDSLDVVPASSYIKFWNYLQPRGRDKRLWRLGFTSRPQSLAE